MAYATPDATVKDTAVIIGSIRIVIDILHVLRLLPHCAANLAGTIAPSLTFRNSRHFRGPGPEDSLEQTVLLYQASSRFKKSA